MKTLIALTMISLATISVSSTSHAEPRVDWKYNTTVDGTATFELEADGNKYCTHPKARYAHTLATGSEYVVDKKTGASANYYPNFSAPNGRMILENRDGERGMPAYIEHTDQGMLYYNNMFKTESGRFDSGFIFNTFNKIGSNVLQTVCSKK